jgi:L-ribulose-5-phosphate 4-epimerase
MSDWLDEKKQVLEAARKMAEKGLVVGTAGNVSLRLPPEGNRELLAITPSSLYHDMLSADDIQIIDFQGQTVLGNLTPSMETGLHIGIYQARQNVNAIIHTHSVYASAVAVTGQDIPPILEDQVAFLGGEIKLARHAPSGSHELINHTLSALENRSAVLLPNHGAVCTGKTLRDAFTASELVEKTAKIFLLAKLAGEVKQLPPETIAALMEFYIRSQES